MFKLLVLSILFAVAAAKPTEQHILSPITTAADATILQLAAPVATTVIHEPALAKVGNVVTSVPTSVSHQSSTIVHDRANVVTPIVAPAIKSHLASVVSAYVAPHSSLLRSYADFPAVAAANAAYQYYPFNFYYGAHHYTPVY